MILKIGALPDGHILRWAKPILTVSPASTAKQRARALAMFHEWYSHRPATKARLVIMRRRKP